MSGAESISVREALAWGAHTLQQKPELGESAVQDATLLLMRASGLDRAGLRAHPERMLSAEQQAEYGRLIGRRSALEPVQYLLGEQEFFGLRLRVTPAVLIPRPETEHLVEAVVARAGQGPDIVDVGTGSGAIALALAMQLPPAKVTAVDLSPEALGVARENAAELGLPVRFLHSDLLTAVRDERFDVVVSNPPYIPAGERAELHPQVREHEPALALFAGDSGLEVYRRLIPQAAEVLRPGGLLAMEIGFGQQEALANLLEGWERVEFVNDLREIARVVLARRPEKSGAVEGGAGRSCACRDGAVW